MSGHIGKPAADDAVPVMLDPGAVPFQWPELLRHELQLNHQAQIKAAQRYLFARYGNPPWTHHVSEKGYAAAPYVTSWRYKSRLRRLRARLWAWMRRVR